MCYWIMMCYRCCHRPSITVTGSPSVDRSSYSSFASSDRASVNATETLVQAFDLVSSGLLQLTAARQDRGLVHQSLVGAAPAYLADDCRVLSDVGRRPLRSNSTDTRKLFLPRTHNKLGIRSFLAAGPRLWNDLPPGLRRPELPFDSFRHAL